MSWVRHMISDIRSKNLRNDVINVPVNASEIWIWDDTHSCFVRAGGSHGMGKNLRGVSGRLHSVITIPPKLLEQVR